MDKFVEWSSIRVDDGKETSVKEIVKSQDGNTSHNADNTTMFLSSQPDRSASQGKQITRQFWKAGDYEVKSSTVAMLPSIALISVPLLKIVSALDVHDNFSSSF